MGAKNAKNGSEAEPKEVEHGGKVIADQILILLISKADRIMTRHNTNTVLRIARGVLFICSTELRSVESPASGLATIWH